MKVVNEFENKLLGRREVTVSMQSDGVTASRSKVKAELVKKLKAKEDLLVVNSIKPHFGSKEAMISAYLYDKKEQLEKLTPEHIVKRNHVEAPEEPVEAQAPTQESSSEEASDSEKASLEEEKKEE